MRKSYNIPLNDSYAMDVNHSPQTSFMPSFLIGNNNNINQNDSVFMNQSKLTQQNLSFFSQLENKPSRPLNRRESFHDPSRRNGPPIGSLRNRSPKSTYVKSIALTNDTSINTNDNASSFLNQSRRSIKPYENFQARNLNTSIRDSENYSRFLNKSAVFENVEDDFDNWITVFGYTPHDARHVLSYFAEIGCIKEHIISNSGNWMHLQYESRMHMVSALNRNGRIINMNTMIGVKNCDDKSVDSLETRRANDDFLNRSHMEASVPSPIHNGSDEILTINMTGQPSETGSNLRRNKSFSRSMRSLNAGPISSSLANGSATADKEDKPARGGMLTRAVSILFGRK